MKFLLLLVAWCLLLAEAWPLAVLVLVRWPVVWLLSIPFRVLGAVLDGMVALVRSWFMLPARLLGG